MKLIYRGTTFDYNPANVTARRPFHYTRTHNSAYELIYRGNTYQVEPTAITQAPVEPVTYELIYRGTILQVSRNEQGEVTAISSSTNLSKKASTTARPSTQQATEEYLLQK
ncbi:DUF4278 domain-containing protein [Allocoleopsis sp.]|uniref:DUF4278 domain-containing protein n=1 Tax=Allocoleopsis sp. TaxID=3088169 RepID=UPI002FD15D68